MYTSGYRQATFKVLYLLWSGSPPPDAVAADPVVRVPAAAAAAAAVVTAAAAAVVIAVGATADAEAETLTSCGAFGVGGGLATVNINKPTISQIQGAAKLRQGLIL